MDQAIKLAIEKGGYDWKVFELGGNYFIKGTDIRMHTSDIILDNQFWQSLGKALGWYEHFPQPGVNPGWWLDKALEYHKLNLTGGDTEKFWSNLLAVPKEPLT